jgi:O-antigen/teichoic acid export membrane protein
VNAGLDNADYQHHYHRYRPPSAALMPREEHEGLRTSFVAYETVINMISIVLFSSAYVLILPFMRIYTSSFSHGIYIQPLLAMLLLTAELVYCLRLPYDTIIMAAGRFDDTKKYAFAEAGLNLILSIILVNIYGLPGVVIGTIIAISFRTICYMGFISESVLPLTFGHFVKRTAVSILSILLNIKLLWTISCKLTLSTAPGWVAGGFIPLSWPRL